MIEKIKKVLGLGGRLIVIGIIAMLILALILSPLLVALGWHLSWWSFEVAVLVLLAMIAYISTV